MDEITVLQAEILKTLASPRRLEILHLLATGPHEVGRLADALGISQPNVSQHLAVLRSAGLVDAERDGREVRYRLSDPDVRTAAACSLSSVPEKSTRFRDSSMSDRLDSARHSTPTATGCSATAFASVTRLASRSSRRSRTRRMTSHAVITSGSDSR